MDPKERPYTLILTLLSMALELPPDMDQCITNRGVRGYNNVKTNINEVLPCFTKLVDLDELQTDIKEDRGGWRRGGVDRSVNKVFMKYCSRKSQLFGCVTEVTESLKPCFKAGERAWGKLDVIRNVAVQVLEFMCQENGDSMELFMDGYERCWRGPDTRKVLSECYRGLEPIFTKDPKHYNYCINALLDIDYDDSTCGLLYEFQKCMVQGLKTCNLEVGNTAHSLIRSILLSTPCKDKPNSASGAVSP